MLFFLKTIPFAKLAMIASRQRPSYVRYSDADLLMVARLLLGLVCGWLISCVIRFGLVWITWNLYKLVNFTKNSLLNLRNIVSSYSGITYLRYFRRSSLATRSFVVQLLVLCCVCCRVCNISLYVFRAYAYSMQCVTSH